jgi:hypothetical protein
MNKFFFRMIVLVICLGLVLMGCDGGGAETIATELPPTVAPSATLPPTNTPVPPTDTPVPPTSTPTNTPEPTATATPMVALSERIAAEGGGFSLQPPVGDQYIVNSNLYMVMILDMNTFITYNFQGTPNMDQDTLESLEKEFAEQNMVDIELTPTTVAEEEAVTFTFSMEIMVPMTSTVVLATPNDQTQVFMGMLVEMDLGGFGELLGGEAPAADEGAPTPNDVFQAILSSVQFTEIPPEAIIPPLSPAACTVSVDEAYGKTTETPIILFAYPNENPSSDYITNILRGPNGEQVTVSNFETVGEAESGDTEMFIKYTVTYDGLTEPIDLYILVTQPMTVEDIEQPPVPVGFTCATP